MKAYEMQEILLQRRNGFAPFFKNILAIKLRKRIAGIIKESCFALLWIYENRFGRSSKFHWDGLRGREKMK
jgi:hypothetical protein